MSGIPFNAMWTAPPPPSYTDTVGVDPTDYVVLTTSHGDEALVHKDCLIESPVLRFCFRKRVPLNTEEVTVTFVAEGGAAATAAAEPTGSAISPFLHTRPSLNTVEEATASRAGSLLRKDGANTSGGEGGGAVEDFPRRSTAAEADAFSKEGTAAAAAARHPVTLIESLCTDNTVRIAFPRLNRAQLEVVVAYLYYKHHYNRRPTEARPHFEIPTSAALEVMRVAKTLNC